MRYRILGALEMWSGADRVAIGNGREQRALAALLLDANKPVSIGRLADLIWDDRPPPAVRRQVSNVLSRLRALLSRCGEPGPEFLAGIGYRIVVAEPDLDASVFDANLARARRFADAGRLPDAAAALRTALDLWRGPLLAGLSGTAVQTAATAWGERRMAAQHTYGEYLLRLDRAEELLPELITVVDAEPLREPLVGQLMLALHRCGRQHDALARYDTVRDRLADELGIDPTPELGRLRQRILTNDPAIAAPSRAPAVPRQLPHPLRHFVGRSPELAALDDLAVDPAGTTVVAIDGVPGIGKTTLAVHWAHRAQDRFPGGTLYADLRGYGPGDPATPSEVLTGFLRALGIPAERIPVDLDERAAVFRSALAGRRVLIVLDNALCAEQVRPLLPGSPGCALVTSRTRLTGLVVTQAAHRLTLDLLTEPEALEFVTGIIGPRRAEPAAIGELIRLCERLPLALRIAAGRVIAHPHVTVADVVAELSDRRLDALSQGGDDRATVRAVFDWSYERLPAAQARLFRCLGLHPGPDLGPHAAAVLAGVEPRRARELLAGLAAVHLVEPIRGGRYRLHDLLRTYAADRADRHDSAAERRHTIDSLLTWYTHTADTCDRLVFPAHHQLPSRPSAPVRPMPITDRTQALAWLDTERVNLVAAFGLAARNDLHQHTFHLVNSSRLLTLRWSWAELLGRQQAGLVAARRIGDRVAEAWFHVVSGKARCMLRQWDEALGDLTRALDLGRDLGDQAVQIGALIQLGLVRCEQERFTDALQHFRDALPLSRGAGSARWEAVIESDLSRVYSGLGCYRDALGHGERGLALCREAGEVNGEAYALHQIARAWQGLGDHRQVIVLCREAVEFARGCGYVAAVLDTLATSLHSTGETADAITCWREAITEADDLGAPHHAVRIRDRLRTLAGHRA